MIASGKLDHRMLARASPSNQRGSSADAVTTLGARGRAAHPSQQGDHHTRTKDAANRRTLQLINRHPDHFQTITADNGTEFHGYADIERTTPVKFYFAQPYHAWERGSNANTNGPIRQYLPKGTSMEHLTQHQCNAIATKLKRPELLALPAR